MLGARLFGSRIASGLLLVGIAAALGWVPNLWAEIDTDRPGETDPISPAGRKTQFASHHAFVSEPDASGTADFTDWVRSSDLKTLVQDADLGAGALGPESSGRIAAGRILDQQADQAALLKVTKFDPDTGVSTLQLDILAPDDGQPVANASVAFQVLAVRSLYLVDPADPNSGGLAESGNGFSYGVAVGNLSAAVDGEGVGHEEVVLCHLAGSGISNVSIQIKVIDYTDFADNQTGLPTTTTATAPKPVNQALFVGAEPRTYYPSNPLVSCATGDIDGDGLEEVGVVYQSDPKTLRVSVFSYINDGIAPPSLMEVSSTDLVGTGSTSFFFPSVDITFGDLNNDGQDEVAVAGITSDGFAFPDEPLLGTFAYVYVLATDEAAKTNLTLKSSEAVDILFVPICLSAVDTCAIRRVRLFSGLFRFLPNADNPAQNYDYTRRQLALVVNRPSGGSSLSGLRAIALRSSLDLQSISVMGSPVDLNTSTRNQFDVATFRWSAASGGFTGVEDVTNPLSSLVLYTWDWQSKEDSAGPYRVYWVQAIPVNSVSDPGGLQLAFTSNPIAENFPAIDSPTPWAAQLPIAAWDRNDETVYLGSPMHFTITDLVSTDFIIYEPPKHMRWVPDDNDPTQGHIQNVSRSISTYIQLKQANTEEFDFSKTEKSDWNVGGSTAVSAALSITGSGSVGVASIKAQLKTKFQATAGYDYDSEESSYNSNYTQNTVEMTDTTTVDDLIIEDVRVLDVWRYPMSGTPLDDGLNAFYDIIFPAVAGKPPAELGVIRKVVGGINSEWYQPVHENGNALSYPKIDGNTYRPPDCCATYSWKDDAGRDITPEPPIPPFFTGRLAVIGGNDSSLKMTFSQESGGGSSKEFSNSLKASADYSIGAKVTAKAFGNSATAQTEVAFNAHGGTTWGAMETGSKSTNSSTGIEMAIAIGNGVRAYEVAPVFYLAQDGTTKAAHGVNLYFGTVTYWQEEYGNLPDPALNMPSRFERQYLPDESVLWIPNETSQYNRIRGFFITSPDTDPVTDENIVYADAVDAGEDARLVVRVYNYSLVDFYNLAVKFDAVEYDSRGAKDVGTPVTLECTEGSTTTVAVRAQEFVEAVCVFDTTPFKPIVVGTLQPYRIWVTLDPNNTIEEIYDGTVGPGQNNLGWGLLSIAHPVDTYMFPTPTETVPAGADVALQEDAIAIDVEGVLETGLVELVEGQIAPIRVCATTNQTQTGYHHVFIWEEDLFTAERTLIADKLMPGIDSDGSSCVWILDYAPDEAGAKVLHAEVLETHLDALRGNATDRLELLVEDIPVVQPNKVRGAAQPIDSGRANGSLRLSGRFRFQGELDLASSTLVISKVLSDVDGVGELMPDVAEEEGQALTLQPLSGGNDKYVVFATAEGAKPSVRVKIETRRGVGRVKMRVQGSEILPPQQCGRNTLLETEMFVLNSPAPPIEIDFQNTWRCRKDRTGAARRLVTR